MRCDNCGMEHDVNENKLCSGPYITQREYRQRVQHLLLLLGGLRNEFNYIVRKHNITLEEGSSDILAQANLELK